jgi:hypothetical protein
MLCFAFFYLYTLAIEVNLCSIALRLFVRTRHTEKKSQEPIFFIHQILKTNTIWPIKIDKYFIEYNSIFDSLKDLKFMTII